MENTAIKNRQTLIGAVIVVLLILAFGYYLYTSNKDGEKVPDVPADSTVAEEDILPGVTVTGDGVSMENTPALPSAPEVPAPSVDRPLTFSASMSEEAREIYRTNIATLTKNIKETGGLVSEWLDLGTLWKQIGDYEGARLAWEYVAAIRPEGNVAFLNLGDLYHYYLKDFPKAEANLKKGIANDPSYVPGYLGLFELYKDSYRQNTASAVNTLLIGLEGTDDNINLLVPLALYYAEKGDSENARVYYEKAIRKAEQDGDTARAELLEAELARLQ